MEIIWTGFASAVQGDLNLIGHTSVWMFFIYGSAAFVLEPIYKYIRDCNVLVRGIVWVELIFLTEFISGLILKLFGLEAWHYECKYSVYGLIRLDYAPLWFIVGMLFEKVSNTISKYDVKG